jgi:hypothetical protein
MAEKILSNVIYLLTISTGLVGICGGIIIGTGSTSYQSTPIGLEERKIPGDSRTYYKLLQRNENVTAFVKGEDGIIRRLDDVQKEERENLIQKLNNVQIDTESLPEVITK